MFLFLKVVLVVLLHPCLALTNLAQYAFAAIKQTGTVVSWGNVNLGGDSSSAAPLNNIVSISTTLYSFAAISASGQVKCW